MKATAQGSVVGFFRHGPQWYHGFMPSGPLRQTTEGPVRVLELDLGKLNVLDLGSLRLLGESIREAERDEHVRSLALLGRPGALSAGLDLAVLAAGGREAQELLLEMGQVLSALYASPLRVVAGATGHAVAAGAMLLLVADQRVGSEGSYRIGFPEVARGMPLPEIPLQLARDRLSPRFLQAATLLGQLFDPREAIGVGFLDATAPAQTLRTQVVERARGLAALPDAAYIATLQRVRGETLARMNASLEAARQELRS